MSRGLTQEQTDYLDKVMKEFRQRTGTAMGSVRRLADQDWDCLQEMNDFESIYQEINMYIFDNRDRRYDLHQRYIPLKDRLVENGKVVE